MSYFFSRGCYRLDFILTGDWLQVAQLSLCTLPRFTEPNLLLFQVAHTSTSAMPGRIPRKVSIRALGQKRSRVPRAPPLAMMLAEVCSFDDYHRLVNERLW